MNLSNLRPDEGSTKKIKRIGRGQGSGHGGTSTRGKKGAGQRSGNKSRRGFEGGQMPLQRRVPKFGFFNHVRKELETINLSRLQSLSDDHKLTIIDRETLIKHGVIRKKDRIKILGNGELTSKIEVKVNAISESAKKAIEAAGGTVNLI